MNQRTPLYEQHIQAGAKIVDFGGWDMPINYGSQIEEHHCVRKAAGIFDVSHMTVVDIEGSEARAFLRKLLANDVDKLKDDGKALYSAMLNEQGGIIDDLIAYRLAWGYRLVVNCATREKDLSWMQRLSGEFDVGVRERTDFAILAIQGPEAYQYLERVLSEEEQSRFTGLSAFQGADFDCGFIAKTGYTGEAGYEMIVPEVKAESLWKAFVEAGVAPVGLGARDTLRLEAGMNLYGQDMDETFNPFQSAMAWTVDLSDEKRDFVGKKALQGLKAENNTVLVGLILKARGVLRAHQKVTVEEGEGEVTSGSFSPTLNCSIAFARIPKTTQKTASVEIRNKEFQVDIVKVPFVRNGQAVYKPV